MSKEPYRTYRLKLDGRPPRAIDYDTALNEAQREAVLTLAGPLLVIAGAGTGKTRTLTYRVARLVESGVPPERIVLLTFTRRAAQEMIGRAGRLVGTDCQALVGGTFHAFAARMLRRYPPEGYPNRFTILDRGDAEDTVQLVRGERGLGRDQRRFPRKQTLADMFSKSINRDIALEKLLAEEYEHFLPHAAAISEIAAAYAAFKREHALMDYDDLLVFLAERLRSEGPARREMQEAFGHVLVDEYQDTNRLQAEITDSLAAEHRNLMVVGDDSQSIYGFRGADHRNILQFPDRYPDARVVKLEQNYRSTQEILEVTNAIIAEARIGFPKRLFTERREGPRPALVMAGGEREQTLFLAQRVLELREEGIPLQEMAILFRNSYQSYDLEIELARRDIPYVKYGGFRFLEAAHIKDVLSHLRVLENPRDVVSWGRLLCLAPGIGPRRAAAVIEAAAGAGDPYLVTAFSASGATRTALGRLAGLFARVRGGELPPAAVVAQVVEYYQPILAERFDDQPRRARDLEQFQVLAEGYTSLPSMLADMSIDPPDRAVENRLASPLDEGERLVLSTIHSAKGMEWAVVFLMGALDGILPNLWSTRELEALEEERRLVYVATTRAKTFLYITYPVNTFHAQSGRVLNRPSRFLDAVPERFMERWAVTNF